MIHENETNNLSKAAAPLISNIVGSVDFSKRSTGAASFTLRMARRFDATIKLLHVEKPIERDTFSMVETMHWAKEKMANLLLESKGKVDVRWLFLVEGHWSIG
jgi:nucleotide-binding universal stress UspA family protein